MAKSLDADAAVEYLREMSSDVRAAVLADERGGVVAWSSESDTAPPHRAGKLVESLVSLAERSLADVGVRASPGRIEVATPLGTVFVLREGGRTLLTVAGRDALPSLMFFDMASVLRDLRPEP